MLAEQPTEIAVGGEIEPDDGALEGATLADLDRDARQHFAISDSVRKGVLVTDVESGSRADRAGLRAGDVILEVDRNQVKNTAAFRKLYDGSKGTLLLLVQRQSSTIYLAFDQ